MREHGVAELQSAPSEHFLNKYSTSSVAEDKAEVWACLMCYQHALASEPLKKKAELMKRRVRAICPEIDGEWWRFVRWHQIAEAKEWERHPDPEPSSESDGSEDSDADELMLEGNEDADAPVGSPTTAAGAPAAVVACVPLKKYS